MPVRRPEPPPPAPAPERAVEVVLLIVIVLNVFFVVAAIVQPLVGPAIRRAGPVGLPVRSTACPKSTTVPEGVFQAPCRQS